MLENNHLEDLELVKKYRETKDEIVLDIILSRYTDYINNKLKRFKIKSEHRDDYFQECQMVVYLSINNFDETKGKSFSDYVYMNIQNKIKNLLRDNYYYFYNVKAYDLEIIDYISNSKNDYDEKELLENCNITDSLSLFEERIYTYLKDNISIKEMSKIENKPIQSIYNAIERVKHKSAEVVVTSSKYKMTEKEAQELVGSKKLSKLEYDCYKLYLQGIKPSKIALKFKIDNEKVYNAIKRAQRKLSKRN